MHIETKRLILRKFTLNDVEDVFNFSSNPDVTKYTGDLGFVKTHSDAKNIIENIWLKEYEKYGYARLALVEKESQQVIGFNGIKFLDDFQMPDLGYRMLPEYWGQGYATESSQAIIDYIKVNMDIKELMAMTLKENIASQNVLLKLGFVHTHNQVANGIDVHIFNLKI